MELTEGVLKSIESSFYQNHNRNNCDVFVLKYKGKPFFGKNETKLKTFSSEAKAKTFLISFVKEIFWQGEYWDKYKDNIERDCGYRVDYSETIKILPQYGLVSRFDEPQNKKMFKKIGEELIKNKIITIEKF